MISLVQRKSRPRSAAGTPSISAITPMVIGAETFWTKSHWLIWPASSSTSRVMRCTFSSRSFTVRGVNCLLATFRYLPWSGGSMLSRCRIERSSGGVNSLVKTARRGSFRKRSGCFESSMMSAYFVTAQNGSVLGRSYQKTGAWRRR